LIVDDPDAIPVVGYTYTHLALINIPRHIHEFNENEKYDSIPGVIVLENSFGNRGWNGPCPPQNSPVHHYRFTLYALDTRIKIPHLRCGQTLTAEIFEKKYYPYIIDKSFFIGKYKR
jgi:Raf kinase inhibitor-like YbhB/YbcL family protein